MSGQGRAGSGMLALVSAGVRSFSSVADELYSLPRNEFTAARNAAAKQAREQGHRELAEQIGGLRRPSTAAWVANLLAREQPTEIGASRPPTPTPPASRR